jgi:antitoxin CptB
MLNAENLRDAEQRRFAWRCRRGLLELDILLQAFVSSQFNKLDMRELQVFDAMLALPDNEFWDLINSSKSLKQSGLPETELTHQILTMLRAVRLNPNQEA